jgi:hypothetical protein
VQNDNRFLTPNENDLDVPTVTHEGLEWMAADNYVNLRIGTR